MHCYNKHLQICNEFVDFFLINASSAGQNENREKTIQTVEVARGLPMNCLRQDLEKSTGEALPCLQLLLRLVHRFRIHLFGMQFAVCTLLQTFCLRKEIRCPAIC